MLPEIYRTTVSEFYQNKQPLHKINTFIFTVFLKTNSKGNARFVISVPKSLDKRSVYRHRTKRLVAEVIRNQLDILKDFHYDFSFKMKKIITKSDNPLLIKEMDLLINGLGKN